MIYTERVRSNGEIRYMNRLIEVYGDDFEKMSRDIRLNWEQLTEGQLRRRCRPAGVNNK